jgi:hypothetical protein
VNGAPKQPVAELFALRGRPNFEAHLCMQLRGMRDERSPVTTVWRGSYVEHPDVRREFLTEVRSHNPWT